MAKFTISTCTRLPRRFRQGSETLPWYNYLMTGSVPAEYHVHLRGDVEIDGVPTQVLATIYTKAGTAKAGEPFVGLRLPFFPSGKPSLTECAPKDDDTDTSAPMREDGSMMDMELDGVLYPVPRSALRAMYTTLPYTLDVDTGEVQVVRRNGELVKAADGRVVVKLHFASDIMPRLKAPVVGILGEAYADTGVENVRRQHQTRSINIVRGAVKFK